MDYNRFEPGDEAVCNPPKDIDPPIEPGTTVEIVEITEEDGDIIDAGPESQFEVWYEVDIDGEEDNKLMSGTWLDRK
jgi:hypothetical protein